MIEPFFFGPGNAFASYQSASELTSSRLLVICPPLFDEYRRCYRALFDLGNACAAQGMHVIRLDYSGTGEAQGKPEDFTIEDWIGDINRVIEEGIALTGAQSVVLAGVRFGATLAAQCQHAAVKRYVFWDPVDSGKFYAAWLAHINSEMEARHRSMARMANLKFEKIDYQAFALSDSLEAGIASLDISHASTTNESQVNVVTTDKNAPTNSAYARCEFTGFEYDWPRFHEGNLHPKPVLERIALMVLQQ